MNGLIVHVGLFAVLSFAVVVMGALYAEPDDRKALASVPRRFTVFMLSCALVAGLMLVLEHTFASVS